MRPSPAAYPSPSALGKHECRPRRRRGGAPRRGASDAGAWLARGSLGRGSMEAAETTGDADHGPLKRALGLPALTFFGVGMILGAGIYAVIGAAAAEASGLLWLSFLVAAAVALATGLSYAELSAMFPRA